MIHLFKVSDKSWVFSGTTIPSNMEGDDYVEGILPEGESWDYEYEYTCVDGIATKGEKIVIEELETDAHIEPRLQAYPAIAEQLYKLWHDMNNDKLNKEGEFFKALKAVKDANPKG